jgi:hypothetical protein
MLTGTRSLNLRVHPGHGNCYWLCHILRSDPASKPSSAFPVYVRIAVGVLDLNDSTIELPSVCEGEWPSVDETSRPRHFDEQ